jgi:hypothetical protein
LIASLASLAPLQPINPTFGIYVEYGHVLYYDNTQLYYDTTLQTTILLYNTEHNYDTTYLTVDTTYSLLLKTTKHYSDTTIT